MPTNRPNGHFLSLLCMAALALLAVLLRSPGEVFATDPEFTDGSDTTRTVPENSAEGTNVGNPLAATDADTTDTLTYALSGTDASSFTIVSTSGQIQTKTGVTYDFEATKNSYTGTVGVRDNSADTAVDATITVTINLTDANEKPEISTTDVAYDFAENTDVDDTAVATIEAADPESGDTLTWTLSGDDKDSFEIDKDAGDTDQDGVLKLESSPDYENPVDTFQDPETESDNVYKVRVNVRNSLDNTGSADSMEIDDFIDLEITVTDANDAPTFTSETATRDVDENTASIMNIGAASSATDEDSDTLTYGMEASGDHSDFTFNASTRRIKTMSALDHELKETCTVTITVHDGEDADGGTDMTVDNTI